MSVALLDRGAYGDHQPLLALPNLLDSALGPPESSQSWPGPHQLVFNEVADNFVVEVLDGGPADALLDILLLGVAKE